MNKYQSRLILTVVVAIFYVFAPLWLAKAEPLTKDEIRLLDAYHTGEIIRLHVIASSNSSIDQAIKLAVRDAIIERFSTEYETKTCDEAYSYWSANLSLLHSTAADTACALGYKGKIQTETGIFEIPEKQYGNITLPSGKYKTIRIVLGNGEGENWWCVLYPKLCLSLISESDLASGEYTSPSVRILRLWFVVPF